MSRLLLALVVTAFVAVPGHAQQPAAGAAALPSFEAASIRPIDPNQGNPIDLPFFPNRFVATTVTLSQLIEQAYGIQPREIVGGPDWVRIERFHVTATTGADVSREQMRLMLQSLLADRFQLEIAREERTGTT